MKSRNHLVLVVIGVVVLLAGAAIGASATQEGDVVERGREDFVEVGCYQCHGYQGQGGAGPRLATELAEMPQLSLNVSTGSSGSS